MIATYKAAPDIDVVTSSFPIPGFGIIPINAFVLHGTEPVLVDTGAVVEREEFMTALRSVIDPADLKWIWLTHTDFDHIGALPQLLAENADLRIITTFLGLGIMSLTAPLPMDRVHLLNPGQTITVGDRTLTAVKPPVFDNPSTTLRQPGSTTTSPARSSALTASERFLRPSRRTRLTSPTTNCGKDRSSGPRSTPLGCTTWTERRSTPH